jgi:hypothetical protein
MLSDIYYGEGKTKFALASIDEALRLPELNDFDRNFLNYNKKLYLGNVPQSVYYLKECHKIDPSNKYINRKIEDIEKARN